MPTDKDSPDFLIRSLRRNPIFAEIEPFVRERLEGDEMIKSLDKSPDGEVMVFLISEELHRRCAPIARKFGRGAGAGRLLTFEKQKGKWIYRGEGGWIS